MVFPLCWWVFSYVVLLSLYHPVLFTLFVVLIDFSRLSNCMASKVLAPFKKLTAILRPFDCMLADLPDALQCLLNLSASVDKSQFAFPKEISSYDIWKKDICGRCCEQWTFLYDHNVTVLEIRFSRSSKTFNLQSCSLFAIYVALRPAKSNKLILTTYLLYCDDDLVCFRKYLCVLARALFTLWSRRATHRAVWKRRFPWKICNRCKVWVTSSNSTWWSWMYPIQIKFGYILATSGMANQSACCEARGSQTW